MRDVMVGQTRDGRLDIGQRNDIEILDGDNAQQHYMTRIDTEREEKIYIVLEENGWVEKTE